MDPTWTSPVHGDILSWTPRDIFIKSPRGHLRFWTFDKFWTFSNCGPFSMPQGSEIQVSYLKGPQLCTFLYSPWLRGPDISQNIHKRLKKYPKVDCCAFAFSCRLVKIQGGNAPSALPIKISPLSKILHPLCIVE